MDALETEHDHPIPQNLGQEAGTLPTTCSAAIGSAEMSGSVTETGGTFPGEVPPLVMVDTPRDDSSHSELSDVQPNSPSVIHLEPGFSLVANSIVVVKCDFGSIKPQTYTYNFTIVNTTTELIELNYQPIMRPPPFQQEQQTPEPIIPLPGVIHSAESVSGLRIPIPRFGGGMSSKHGKVVKEEPVDFSITMNVSSDTEMDTLHDFGGDMTSDSLDSQRQCLNTSDRTSTTTLQDQVDYSIQENFQLLGRQSSSAECRCLGSTHLTTGKGIVSEPMPKDHGDKDQLHVYQGSSYSTPGKSGVHTTLPLEGPLKCEYCEKSFKKNSNLQRHLRIHRNERPHICGVCSKAFTETHALKVHERTHTGDRRYKCPYPDCDKAYLQWLGLDHHVNSVHTGKRDHLCDICGAVFLSRTGLNAHKNIHKPKTDARPFSCQYCDKTYKTRPTLVLHTSTHTGNKPHKCSFPPCEKTFITLSRRKQHETIHTGEKRFRCDHCGKTFRRRGPCVEHMNTHTGERPYKCRYCHKTFAAKATVYNHEKMHNRAAGKQEKT
ncbi:zinc finger protein 658B-like isoform X8 [Lineus longissimus]|uniref:zinc finger protein 658B-like isoform X8 n=1 Tax=Lineus longissimus TaxID=88925 RepID=UPI00315DF2BD